MSNSEQLTTNKREGIFDLINKLDRRIESLEKENTELKEKLAKAQKEADYHKVEAEALSAAMD